jgi:hypothetical protein
MWWRDCICEFYYRTNPPKIRPPSILPSNPIKSTRLGQWHKTIASIFLQFYNFLVHQVQHFSDFDRTKKWFLECELQETVIVFWSGYLSKFFDFVIFLKGIETNKVLKLDWGLFLEPFSQWGGIQASYLFSLS